MTFAKEPARRLKISDIGFEDWALISFALAVAATLFLLIFIFAAWAVGMPGPYLWMGSGNFPADILDLTVTVLPAIFIANVLGASLVMVFSAAWKKFRRS